MSDNADMPWDDGPEGEDAAFVRAIDAAPCDAAPRLVFADWLDENGRGPEAEWLRLDVGVAEDEFIDPADFRRKHECEWPVGVDELWACRQRAAYRPTTLADMIRRVTVPE